MPVASGAAEIVFLGLLDDFFGLLRWRIAGDLLGLGLLGGAGGPSDHWIGGRSGGDLRDFSRRYLERLADANQAVVEAVGLLDGGNADTGLLGDPGQRVAFLHLVGAGCAGRLGMAAVGGRCLRSGFAFLQLRRLRQHRDVFARLLGRIDGQVFAARGFRLRRLRIVVRGRYRCLLGIDIGRDDDFGAGLKPVQFGEPVGLHDHVGRYAEPAREVVDCLAFPHRHLGAAGTRPALGIALFGGHGLLRHGAGGGVVDRLHGGGRRSADRLRRNRRGRDGRECAAGHRT